MIFRKRPVEKWRSQALNLKEYFLIKNGLKSWILGFYGSSGQIVDHFLIQKRPEKLTPEILIDRRDLLKQVKNLFNLIV